MLDTLLIGTFLTRIRSSLKIVFQWSAWAKIALTLGIFIYEIELPNRLKPRIHIDKMLKHFSIKTPRSDSCRSHMESVFARLGVSKHWWAKYMMEIPHTFVFGLIMYSMVCKTTRYVQYSKVVASIDTKVIKVLIMGQQWKMSLSL